MNKQLRHLAVVTFVLFAVLLGSTTYTQYFDAPSLQASQYNSRTLYKELGRDRGPILVDGTPIAQSVPSHDNYKYIRKYGGNGINPDMYAAVTGFYSVIGKPTGLELAENDRLSGTADSLFFHQLSSLFTGTQPAGAAVSLTINPKAQKAAWDALGNQKGAAVAMNPKTGDILAMVSKPGWDPNKVATHNTTEAKNAYDALIADKNKPLYNRAIAGNLYPPGSTFKMIVASAALESGNYTPESTLPGPASITLPHTSTQLRNDDRRACGAGDKTSLTHALAISCNTAFASLGMDLGADAVRKQAEKFGFGDNVNVPMPVTPSTFPDDLNEGELAQSSIGQFDVKATPMEMCMVAAAIANNGTEMVPNLVKSVRSSNSLDVLQRPSPQVYGNPISDKTASSMTDMMEAVVQNGTGTVAQIPGVKVAAKTGTAQNVAGAAPHAWFTSFAPADDPEVAVAVVVEHGGNAGSESTGARTAGPVATAITKAVLNS